MCYVWLQVFVGFSSTHVLLFVVVVVVVVVDDDDDVLCIEFSMELLIKASFPWKLVDKYVVM